MTLNVRIPGWLNDRPMSGDLYSYLSPLRDKVKIAVNGVDQAYGIERGYAQIPRTWSAGDNATIDFPMDVRRVVANPKVEDDLGKMALERGPIVFCLEGVDQPQGKAIDIVIPDTARLGTAFRPDLLGGVQVITGKGFGTRRDAKGEPAIVGERPFTAIPYYAWAHRGMHEMTVWPAREVAAARAEPAPTIASTSKVTSSNGNDAGATHDQMLPKNSNDQRVPRFHWWPNKGSTEWLQYEFQVPAKVSGSSVYWFDDTGMGGCRVPKSWRILYRDGKEWKPVAHATEAGVNKDKMNSIMFDPVLTDGLRLEVKLQDEFSGGVFEWEVKR